MPPSEEKVMNDLLTRAELIFGKMENQAQLLEQQIKMSERRIDEMIQMNRDRMNENDKKWISLRNTMITALVGLIGLIITLSVTLDKKTTAQEIGNKYFNKDEVYRGMGEVIDDTYDTFEDFGMDKEQAKEKAAKTKEDVLKEMEPTYKTRSAKN